MQDWQDIGLARVTLDTLCRLLDKKEWHYNRDDDKLRVTCGARGDDLPMDLIFTIDPEKMLISVISPMPFTIPEEKRLEVAVAVSAVNNRLAHGCFDIDVADGHIYFRMCNSFIESKIGEGLFYHLLMASCQMVDEYNEKFLMMGKGMLSLEKFLEIMP